MSAPKKSLSIVDAVAMVMGIVIGAGIFSLPPFVAGSVDGLGTFIAVWLAGGLVSLIGALCYAELATTYPNTGGDYHFLMRAFGTGPAFLFAWARLAIIQTGSVALMAFVIGDYVAATFADDATSSMARWISSVSAAAVVIGLTALNMAGIREGKSMQKILTGLVLLGLGLVMIAGTVVFLRDGAVNTADVPAQGNSIGMAMVFVMLTYGGWNEAAYLSAEMQGGRRSIAVALVVGLIAVAAVYVLVNLAYAAALGFSGMSASTAIAADTLQRAWGTTGAMFITVILIVGALSTANATIFTGARTNYALGRDFSIFRFLGQWNERKSTPRNALLVQGLVALALIGIGSFQRSGVKAMVEYTSPVFWFFFLLVGISLLVLRHKDPAAERPFRVPIYPLLPVVFCATSGYMLYASLAYTQRGALLGLGVLAAGVPVMLLAYSRRNGPPSGAPIATQGE